MKPTKGINQDVTPKDIEDGYYFFGKNGILNDKLISVENESGFIPTSSNIPYTVIGVLPLDNDVIIFSTDNTNCAIGIYNEKTDIYTNKINRTDLGFNTSNPPIIGEVKRGFDDDIIVAFSDKTNLAYIINLTKALPSDDLSDYYLFHKNKVSVPRLIDVTDVGGGVKTGLYYIIIKYRQLDGSETNWSKPSRGVFINDEPKSSGSDNYDGCLGGLGTSKAIIYDIEYVDTTYDKIVIGMITQYNGIKSASEIIELDISGHSTIRYSYTGLEDSTPIAIDEVLINYANYNTIGTFAQLNGVLYAGNLTSDDVIKFQKLACNIKLGFTSELTDPTQLYTDVKIPSNKTPEVGRGFLHEEVYAFYIRFKIKGFGVTPGFHIPGREPTPSERELVIPAQAGGLDPRPKVFQTQNTITNIVNIGNYWEGDLGVWENENETYPNDSEFDGRTDYNNLPINNGIDLRGKKVRHHKFPSISYCKTNMYGGEPAYGTRYLDLLGITIKHIIIPEELKSRIEGYEILYAKRTTNNSTIYGQSILQLGAPFVHSGDTNSDKVAWSSGGNWDTYYENGSPGRRRIQPSLFTYNPLAGNSTSLPTICRLYSFDLLLDKPLINPTHLSLQLGLRTSKIEGKSDTNNRYYFYHRFQLGLMESIYQDGNIDKLKSINDFRYIPHNTINIADQVYNLKLEEYIHVKLKDGLKVPMNIWNTFQTMQGDGNGAQELVESTILVNLCGLKSDIYSSFMNQTLIPTGRTIKDLNSTTQTKIYGGDIVVAEHSYISYTVRSPDSTATASHVFNKTFIVESIHNPGLRYQDPIEVDTFYTPKQPINDLGNHLPLYGGNSNQWLYNKDFTNINDMSSSGPYNYNNKVTNKFPYRIIRANNLNLEGQDVYNWRVFSYNDYYERIQNRGQIINLESIDNNELLIHYENALHVTRGQTKLTTDIGEVTLGSGDIFDVPPMEILSSQEGSLGTIHQLSCLKSLYGYVFTDYKTGNLFLYKGGQVTEMGNGISRFLRDNLNVPRDNSFTDIGITIAYDNKYKRFIYTVKNNDKSFTISIDAKSGSTCFFHDYTPDFLFNTREGIFSINNSTSSKLFIHNKGPKGVYYSSEEPIPEIKPFFIDVVVKGSRDNTGKLREITLQSVQWSSQVIDLDGNTLYNETFDKVTVWNDSHCSGKVDITKDVSKYLNKSNNRHLEDYWNFNDFRDLVMNRDTKFIDTIFNDFNIIDSNIDNNKSWFERRKLQDTFFIIRLEYSNLENKQLYLYETLATAKLNFR